VAVLFSISPASARHQHQFITAQPRRSVSFSSTAATAAQAQQSKFPPEIQREYDTIYRHIFDSYHLNPA